VGLTLDFETAGLKKAGNRPIVGLQKASKTIKGRFVLTAGRFSFFL